MTNDRSVASGSFAPYSNPVTASNRELYILVIDAALRT